MCVCVCVCVGQCCLHVADVYAPSRRTLKCQIYAIGAAERVATSSNHTASTNSDYAQVCVECF